MNENEEQYTTLFCEGDGTIGFYDGIRPRVGFFQKEREVLDYIASLVAGGRLYPLSVWTLVYNGKNCKPLLEMFSEHVVSSRFLSRLNVALEAIGLPLAVQHQITLDGFVGFWDAEGSSFNQPSISASQKTREILDIISGTFDGSVSKTDTGYQWFLSGDKARELARVVLSKSHCPTRAGRLRQNFEGPSYYDTHKEEQKVYHTAHNKAYSVERKLTREYVRTHPEVVAKVLERTK